MFGVSVVLYRSDSSKLRATLVSVAAQTMYPAVIAIHVNSAADVDLDELRREVASAAAPIPVDVTVSSDNLGFAGGHNRLLATLFDRGCAGVLVLNPDLVLAASALEELASAADALGELGLLGPALELADPQTLAPTGLVDSLGIRWTTGGRHLDDRQGTSMPTLPPQPVRVGGISGACLYVPRASYDRLVELSGEFFDAAFVAYREDAELAFRAAELGIHSYLVPLAHGHHARGLRGTERGRDVHIDRLGVRNRFLIAFKYGTHRPGGVIGPLLRDVVVVLGVLTRERSSLPGLQQAWRLRHEMRAKGLRIRAAAMNRK